MFLVCKDLYFLELTQIKCEPCIKLFLEVIHDCWALLENIDWKNIVLLPVMVPVVSH